MSYEDWRKLKREKEENKKREKEEFEEELPNILADLDQVEDVSKTHSANLPKRETKPPKANFFSRLWEKIISFLRGVFTKKKGQKW